jgi:hypothetical protein
VCQHDTICQVREYIWFNSVFRTDARGVMVTLRILTVIYVVQAAAGIVTGVAYAVWLLYW